MTEVLLDTNILVYIQDPRDRHKQDRSRTLVDELIRQGVAVLSVQCINEFYRAVRWKVKPSLSHRDSLQRVNELMRNCRVLPLTATATLDGMRACEEYSMSFWDALIWAVAKEGGVPYLLTEDFDDGMTIEGVHFADPFVAGFDLAALLS